MVSRSVVYLSLATLLILALPDIAAAQVVESTLEQFGTGVSGWVAAAAIILCVILGLMMMRAGFNVMVMLIPIIGFIIATNPEEIRAWLP